MHTPQRGHESVEQFLARVRATAFIHELPDEPNKRGQGRKKRVVKLAENLTGGQLAALIDLAEGRAVRITVEGRTYVYWSSGFMRGTGPLDEKYAVTLTSCTCRGHTFHGVECKHMRALGGFQQ